MAKKISTKVLCCLLVIAILMSTMPASVFALGDAVTATTQLRSLQMPEGTELRHDDGEVDSYASSGSDGYAVFFSNDKKQNIKGIRICGARYDDTTREFDVELWDENLKTLYSASYDYTDFFPESTPLDYSDLKWVTIDVPNIEVINNFYVVIFTYGGPWSWYKGAYELPALKGGIVIGRDFDTKSGNSFVVNKYPNNRIVDWPTNFNIQEDTDWMIRAVVCGANSEDHAPVITSITADPSVVSQGGSSTITVVASDPDGDELSYSYEATGGEVSGDGSVVTWIADVAAPSAPPIVGKFKIDITVSDGKESVSDSIDITVTGSGDGPEPNITAQIYSNGWQPVGSFSIYPQAKKDMKFTIENEGGNSNLGYIDISASNGLDIISWEDDSSGNMNYENLGPNSNNPTGKATYSDGSQHVPQFELLSGFKPFGRGEKNTVTVTVKATGEGEQWITYRASMASSDGYVRDPSSGDVDQQGWHAHNITVTVDGIQPDVIIPISDEYADWISIGDLNDDKLNDIVMENGDVFYQQLDNSFLSDNLGLRGITICAGKINNDDLIDIVTTGYYNIRDKKGGVGFINISYQQNDKTFKKVPDLTIETGYFAGYCQIDDINDDNLNDILVTFYDHETSTKIYYQKEDGSFSSTPDINAPWLSGIVSLTDFNRDGLKDLVGESASTWGLVVYFQSQDHTFDSTYDERMTHLPFGVDTSFKGMGDVDGNGLDDIIYNNKGYPDQSVAYRQFSDHNFIASDTPYVTGRDVNSIDIGDLNNDGQNDVAIFYEDHTVKGPGFIGIYYQKAMKAEILSPTTDFSVLKDSNVPLKVKVTYEGEPTTGAILTASFSNGDPNVKLTEGENGMYTGTWTPTNILEGQVESPVEITIEAYHGIFGRVYAKVDGVIKTEIPLNIDILSPDVGFTVNKYIPQLIRMKVTDGSGNVVPGSTITKSEASFSNDDSTILLYDDGAHHDGSADDGIYANVWIPENIDSENNIDVGIEVKVYSGDIVLASKEVDGVLTPNEYVLLDTVVAYEDDISKSSVISVYYNVSKEDPEQYNLFLEINRKIPEDLDYDPFEMCPQCYPANSFGTIALSIPENVDFVNSLRGTYGLNWTKYRKKVPNSDKWPRGSVIPQYFSCKEHYEDITMGIKKPAEREKMTADVLSVLNTIIDKIPGYNVPTIFDVFLTGGSYVLETSEDTVFDADLIIGENSVYKEFSELNARDTIVLNWVDGGDYWEIYESVVTMAPLKFQDTGTHELVVQSFFDLEGNDVLYNKKVSMNIFGVDDENIQPNGQIWGDVKLEEGFEVIDNKIMYNGVADDKPRLSTAISVSRKVNKTDPNKQVLYFEISRKTDPENDHKLVEGGWQLWPDWPEWLMSLWPYLGEPTVPVYIPQSAAYGCLHHNLEDIVFQISFDEDIDIMYNKIKDYEIGQRNFINHDLYERWPDGDQLTDDKESFIPQYFEYTDALLYPETEEGRHYNFYKEVPSVNNWDKQMAVLNLYLSFVPYINWLTTFDTILDLWSNEHGIEFIDNQKPYEEILDINERDLIIRDFLHKRPNDLYESIVSEIPIILNNKPTDVYFTIFFNVGGKGKSGKTAAYSKKMTLINEIPPGEQLGNTITNTIGMEFVLIPAGKFEMGSPLDEEDRGNDEGPVHHVNIEEAFYMCKYEVTQKQWREIMGDKPSWFTGDDDLPVEAVSWDEVQEFIRKLNEKEGTDKYRLPSEAEWEYGARAGTTTRYSFGDDDSNLGDYAWYDDNSGDKTHLVGQKKSNSWGLYDMHGNVWEWVQDCWHDRYNGAPTDGSAWVVACKYDGAYRVIRGGGWGGYVGSCRSAIRYHYGPRIRYYVLGFRLLKEV